MCLNWTSALQCPTWNNSSLFNKFIFNLQDEIELNGIILTSSILIGKDGNPIPDMALNTYKKPVLIVHHKKDECIVTNFSDLSKLSSKLNSNNRNEVIIYSEGITQGDACQAMSHHGFNGIEQQVVSKIVDWVIKNWLFCSFNFHYYFNT